jgi:hypothetical protein
MRIELVEFELFELREEVGSLSKPNLKVGPFMPSLSAMIAPLCNLITFSHKARRISTAGWGAGFGAEGEGGKYPD